jgi:3-deoxy-7-phosphoheptulonate synthase
MILVLKPDAAKNTTMLNQLVTLAESYPGIKTKVNTIQGETRAVTEIHLHGPTGTIPSEPFEQFDVVERVVRITEKFRSIGRHGGGLAELGFTYNGVTISQDNLTVFAGLCAVDNRENVEETFRTLKEHGIVTTRAGAYKPRTSPYDFQGHGAKCLPYVFELAGKYGIKII